MREGRVSKESDGVNMMEIIKWHKEAHCFYNYKEMAL
jgi:hypothetical protein